MSFLDTLKNWITPKMLSPIAEPSEMKPQKKVIQIPPKASEIVRNKFKEAKATFQRINQPTVIEGKGPDYGKEHKVIDLDELERNKQAVQRTKTEYNGKNPYRDMFVEVFGNEADNFERVMPGENPAYDPRGEYTENKDGSIDRGLLMINSNTFNDFMSRKPQILYSLGIHSYDDMFDPYKNIQMAKLIFDEQGYGAWYGAPEDLMNRGKL